MCQHYDVTLVTSVTTIPNIFEQKYRMWFSGNNCLASTGQGERNKLLETAGLAHIMIGGFLEIS